MYPSDVAGARFVPTDTSFVDPHMLHPVPQSAPKSTQTPPAADQGISAGAAHLVWGNDKNGETATATLKDTHDRTVGTVVVDHKTNTVTVTDGYGGSSTFSEDKEGNIVNNGSLMSIDEPPDDENYFTQGRYQNVQLQDDVGDSPPISVDIAPNLNFNRNGSNTGLGVLLSMPAKDSSGLGSSTQLLVSAGSGPGDPEVDPKQLTADYYGDPDSPGKQTANFASPMPPASHPHGFWNDIKSLF